MFAGLVKLSAISKYLSSFCDICFNFLVRPFSAWLAIFIRIVYSSTTSNGFFFFLFHFCVHTAIEMSIKVLSTDIVTEPISLFSTASSFGIVDCMHNLELAHIFRKRFNALDYFYGIIISVCHAFMFSHHSALIL